MIVTASRLNIRSGPGTRFRILGTLANGQHVDRLESVDGWAWVYPGAGWVSEAYLADAPEKVKPAKGLEGIIRTFGQPGTAACSAGRVKLPEPLAIGWMPGKTVETVACHERMVGPFAEAFADLYRKDLWGLLHTYDGLYNMRRKTGGREWSTHAWGIAVDLNAGTNRFGQQGDMDKRVVAVFEAVGFTWGGRWSNPDPQHFQYASGY